MYYFLRLDCSCMLGVNAVAASCFGEGLAFAKGNEDWFIIGWTSSKERVLELCEEVDDLFAELAAAQFTQNDFAEWYCGVVDEEPPSALQIESAKKQEQELKENLLSLLSKSGLNFLSSEEGRRAAIAKCGS